jgi:hypothetical protein
MKHFLKRTFGIIAVFILLVAALEMLYRLLKVPKISHQSIYAIGQSVIPKINNNTILLIGDSRLQWGIKPILVMEKMKAAGYNCNVVDMAMPGSNGLDMLHYLIQHNIHPKLIIHGYGANYAIYQNHGFDKQEYSEFNKISENFSYWLDQHFYFRDQSVMQYVRRSPLYFKSHSYDSLGGATVTEYGDYANRSATQIEMYKGFKTNFKQAGLDKYSMDANAAIEKLKSQGAIVYGLYMPISKKIFDLQNASSNWPANIVYNKFYDFADFTYTNETPAHDSVYFYDGCHLRPEYGTVFTGVLVDSLQKDLAEMK